ncbi:MAG: hypothetical protein Tsb0034_24870 [Ekhidna sp.]
MKYFDQIYLRIFGREKQPTSVMINEIIKRSQNFLQRFNAWKASDVCEEFLNDLWQSYFWRKQGIEKEPHMVLHESNYSNGFAISYMPEYDRRQFHYLFDLLADQVKKLDYRLVLSRSTMKESDQGVEKKEMHYLKPKRGFVEPIDQKFGNVQIEYIELNNEPTRIKFVANSYPDRKYTEAKNFESLAQHVFTFESKQS